MYTMHNQFTEYKSKKSIVLFTTFLALSFSHLPEAFAQGTFTLHDPLVPGSSSSLPGVPSRLGVAPPPGAGSTPLPVTPGMTGPPTLIPSIPAMPSNQINSYGFSGIGLPISPGVALPPGSWGPLLTPFIPNSPSTPGTNPAPYGLRGNYSTQAMPTNVQAAGGLPGTGGYYTTIPNVRAVATQDSITGGTNQYERRGHISFLGGGGNSQDIITQFGPLAGFGIPFGVPTGPGYGKGPAASADNYNKSIDLGGGMRIRVAGQPISTGKTVQDLNGYNVLYGNATPSLGANLSTEFGQGAPLAYGTVGTTTHYTTDFGLPLRPQTGLNAHPNEPLHTLPQNAIETNF